MPNPLTKKYSFYIGIDPGVNTGLSIWDKKQKTLIQVQTIAIHKAWEIVTTFQNANHDLFIRVEDARQRKWIPQEKNIKQRVGRAKGAGSVSRDCTIWEDFLTDLKVDFEMVAPRKGMTKYDEETFKKITGYSKQTSSHARDAAMLVYGM